MTACSSLSWRRSAATRASLEAVLAAAPATHPTLAQPGPAATARRTERTTALSFGDVAQDVRQEKQRTRRSHLPLALGAAAVTLLVGVVLLLTPLGGRSPLTANRPSQTTADGASGGLQQAAAAPSGWIERSASGWTTAVPPSYVPGTFNGAPQYKDPATGRTLRVSTTGAGGGKADAVQDRRDQAAAFAARHSGYREIGIAKTGYRGLEAADWEFTYADGGASLHALSRVFVVGGRGYSLFFQTRSTDDWAAARSDFDQIAASFQP